ncbi:DNA polymerase III subunit beta [Thermanaerosceptrum fracticalcis]|nr:DNA polymerase III subunit beta [Thermanaerosceptrum fracticalcis]
MKITATKENLLFGVQAVQKAVSTKNTLPILIGIKIEAQGNLLYFTATDLEMGIQCYVPADIIYEGAIVVPARHFSEIVRRLPNCTITLELNTNHEITIKYENSELTLKTLPPDDFPVLPNIKGNYEISVQASLLRQMIRQTVFAAGNDEARPLFTGILCEVNENKLRMIATDTHRLALREGIPQSSSGDNFSFIVPRKIMSELARLIVDEDEPCFISVTKNQVSFMSANIRLMCRLLEGQFPNYRQVIPTQFKSKIRCKTKLLQESLERISLFSMQNDNSNTINIKIDEMTIVVSSRSELGQGYEQIAVEQEGEPVNISFNARYLIDVLKNVEAEMVTIEFTGPLSPGIVRPADSDNFLYLILPVRS